MNAAEIRTILQAYFRENAERFAVETAFLFGSWASNVPRKEPDVDVAILFRDEGPADTLFERATTISLELARKTGVEADVLVLDKDLSRPMLHYNAVVQGIPVYMRDFTRAVDLRMRALIQAEDFALFGKRLQDAVVRKRLEALSHA